MPTDQMRAVSDAGERVYAQAIGEAEKASHKGHFVAIDTVTGRYAFGNTPPATLSALGVPSPGVLPYLRPVGPRFRLRSVPGR